VTTLIGRISAAPAGRGSAHEFTTLACRGVDVRRHALSSLTFPRANMGGAFFGVVTMTQEKITEQIKLHLPESMKRDLQDAAMADDRKVSDYIRHVLSNHLYGIKGVAEREANCKRAVRDDEGRD
jgi:hypothetical protein